MRKGAVALVVALLAGCGPAQQSGQQPDGAQESNAAQLAECPATESRPPVTNSLPDITLPCLGDGPDTRLADLRGPMLVNVWAQWCPPCREEAPYLAELHRKAGAKVKILGIDYADPREELAVRFAVAHGLAYPHLADPDKQLQQPWRIAGPPLTVFVDAEGRAVYTHRGPFASQEQLDDLVAEKLGVHP